jgi:hypothetical protein
LKPYSSGKVTIAALDDDTWSEVSEDSLEIAMHEAELAQDTLEDKLSKRGGVM